MVGNVVATVLLMLVSIAVAGALFLASLVWALDSRPDTVGFALGVYVPPILAVLGVVAGIIALARRRPAWMYPLSAIVLGLIALWIGSILIAS